MAKFLILFLICVFVSGCATVTYPPPGESRNGVYHKVGRNITLWGIAKAYNVSLTDIVNSNRIPDADKIEIGQYIFIPGRNETIRIDPEFIKSGYETFVWPVRGKVISHFASIKKASKNRGIDISAPFGKDVIASRSGEVTFSTDSMKGYGKTIIIDHGEGYQTVYTYNSENLVKVGDRVRQNQVIAKIGKGGRAMTPSLHFEIRKKHKPQNPFYYLP